MKNLIQAPGGVSKKAPIRNPLEEVLEIGKKAVEQTGVAPVSPEQPQTMSQSETSLPQPSLIEKRKNRMMIAHRAELEQMQAQARQQRKQQESQVDAVERQEEQQKEQVVQQKKQSIFEKGLALVRKRGPGIETRRPKAA